MVRMKPRGSGWDSVVVFWGFLVKDFKVTRPRRDAGAAGKASWKDPKKTAFQGLLRLQLSSVMAQNAFQ